MERNLLFIGVVLLALGVVISLSWEASFSPDGGIIYFFMPWGLLLLVIGSLSVYYSFKIS
jgi:hypothetical protein